MPKYISTANRYACCEHCIDIKEGCPRPFGHAAPCRLEGCSVGQVGMYEQDENWDAAAPKPSTVETDISEYMYDHHIEMMRDELITDLISVIGYEPQGLRVLLRTLSHPSLSKQAVEYFEAMDISSRCTKYEAPWTCAKEAEAQYQNIAYGWSGAAGGVGVNDSWCENCRGKVLGTQVPLDAELENRMALETLNGQS